MGTMHGLAYVGDLNTLCAISRSEARTTNLANDISGFYREEWGYDLLVEHRNATQRTASPLSKIVVELGIEYSDEGAHERDLESWTGNWALTPKIHELIVCNQDN